jgi:hypothetical protein
VFSIVTVGPSLPAAHLDRTVGPCNRNERRQLPWELFLGQQLIYSGRLEGEDFGVRAIYHNVAQIVPGGAGGGGEGVGGGIIYVFMDNISRLVAEVAPLHLHYYWCYYLFVYE